MLDFRLKLVTSGRDLTALADRLASVPAFALDIETADWWDRRRERVSLVQFAYRAGGDLRVAVVDALAVPDLEPLRPALERAATTKAIHNAAFDATRLARHYSVQTSPVHDTMLAARKSGERRYSLGAQAQEHLGIALDKGEQQSDWSRRPLTPAQLRYAGADAACTLLLYEDQRARGLVGSYRLRADAPGQTQDVLPLTEDETPPASRQAHAAAVGGRAGELRGAALALLGVATELAGRYSPERLAVSADAERVGLTGWIIDRVIGTEAEIDEESARLAIAELCERGLVEITPTRRLRATDAGAQAWRKANPA